MTPALRRTRAALLVEPGRVETTDDLPVPECGPNEVTVRMHGVGLCGTDLSVHDGVRPVPSLPWVMGHEGFGEVVAVGDGVHDRRPGQRVVVEPNYPCLECAVCLSGRTSGCPERGIVGINVPGLLAELVNVPARFAWPAPGGIGAEDLVCTEPLAVARSAVLKSGAREGDPCLVVGGGAQGQLLTQLLLAEGALPRVVEPNSGRRGLVRSLGAETVAPEGGADHPFVFETSGAAAGTRVALDRAAVGAHVVFVGLCAEALPVTGADVVRRQLRIEGSMIYDHPGDFRATVGLLAEGSVRPSATVSDRFTLETAGRALSGARSAPGKTWIDLRGSGQRA